LDEAETEARGDANDSGQRRVATNERGEHMEAVEFSQQQSLRIAELPEDYQVVGVDGCGPLVRKPPGQVLCVQQSGRLTRVTTAAKRGIADHGADEPGHLAGGVQATTPYTSVSG
jgi:hypothetical protein